MYMTVGQLIEQLKQYPSETLVVVPDTAARHEDWDDERCWTEVLQVFLKDTPLYRPRVEHNTMLFGASAWVKVPAVRLACDSMTED